MPSKYLSTVIVLLAGVAIFFIIQSIVTLIKAKAISFKDNNVSDAVLDDETLELLTRIEDDDLTDNFSDDFDDDFDDDDDENQEVDFQLGVFTQMRMYIKDVQVYNSKSQRWINLYVFPPAVRDKLLLSLTLNDELSDLGGSDYNESLDGYAVSLLEAQQNSTDIESDNTESTVEKVAEASNNENTSE